MRILITGVSGQIGTNLALRCIKDGHDIYGVDIRPNEWTLDICQSICDLSNSNATDGLIRCLKDWGIPDVVVHLAAHAKVHQLVLEPYKALENITMTQQVLEYCRIQHIPIIFSSSREVYGNVSRSKTGEEDADFTQAASPYAASKLSGEAQIYSYARCYGLQYLVFRLSNVYGRFDIDLERMERVIPLFIQKIQKNEPLTLFGQNKVLDFTYIDDCIDGIMLGIKCLVRGTVFNETINLARGEGNTLFQLCQYLAETLNMQFKIKNSTMQTGEIFQYVARLDRAQELLGFSPKYSLPEGLRKAISWGCDRGGDYFSELNCMNDLSN